MTLNNSNCVALEIKGLGHVPSFKNNKLLTRGRLITNPKRQKWMEAAIRSLQSQLRSGFQTTGAGISTGRSAQSWTALSAHSKDFDDSWQWVPRIAVTVERVEKGMEGAMVEVQRL